MSCIRLIARLDVKGKNLIKGVHLEGLRVVGRASDFARIYYEEGIDEILFMDAVATLYGRNTLHTVVEEVAKDVFVPVTVGGGIKNIGDIQALLDVGADKVAINTAAIKNPSLISEGAKKFGSQCIVVSIEAKSTEIGGWEAYIDNGREHTGIDAIEWSVEAQERGAGELLVTSIDQEGTLKGFDMELLCQITSRVSIPVIACGGMGSVVHGIDVVKGCMVDAVAMASVLHYGKLSIGEIRRAFQENDIEIRVL